MRLYLGQIEIVFAATHPQLGLLAIKHREFILGSFPTELPRDPKAEPLESPRIG